MENQELMVPGIIFLVLLVGLSVGLKLSPLWSFLIALGGLGVAYYLLSRGKNVK